MLFYAVSATKNAIGEPGSNSDLDCLCSLHTNLPVKGFDPSLPVMSKTASHLELSSYGGHQSSRIPILKHSYIVFNVVLVTPATRRTQSCIDPCPSHGQRWCCVTGGLTWFAFKFRRRMAVTLATCLVSPGKPLQRFDCFQKETLSTNLWPYKHRKILFITHIKKITLSFPPRNPFFYYNLLNLLIIFLCW